MLLADKMVGHLIPIRFVVFVLVGGLGLMVHLALLWLCLNPMQLPFALSQATANLQQLADLSRSPADRMEVRARALVIRIDLQLRGGGECWHRHLAVRPTACVLVGRGHRRSGHQRREELCGYFGSDLA
jgi:hypothetical protein